MDLKNAFAVCLISLFSATLVVLIARALDRHSAAQIEPQLAAIVEELQAIRKQGGLAAPTTAEAKREPSAGLMVYYFHNDQRCPTCMAIEEQTLTTLKTDFAREYEGGQIGWKILNYVRPAGAELGRKFEVTDPVVVVARMKDNQVAQAKRLDRVMALAGDKAALGKYVRDEIRQMLEAGTPPASGPAALPGPTAGATADAPSAAPAKLPLPAPKSNLPLPK